LPRTREQDSDTRLSDVQHCLDELNACWEKLQGQVDDKQARLEHTLHFQHLYQEALLNISAWLDDIEARLFCARPDISTEEQFKENEVNLEDLIIII
jgi:cob(I)alamin adenosyltransferase